MKKKLLALFLTLSVCAVPLWAIVSGRSLTSTLKELCTNLRTDYQQRAEAQQLNSSLFPDFVKILSIIFLPL